MKKLRSICILLAMLMMTASFAACNNDSTGQTSSSLSSGSLESAVDSSGTVSSDAGTDSFNYSEGIDENGFWKGVTAKDFVELFAYDSMKIPAEKVETTDDEVQEKINTGLSSNATKAQITDRAVVDGDTVNIDYVGSVDGVEFDGGNTDGKGVDVTIGVTTYIDDFLEQLIGHKSGETFEVNVTFPDVYENNPALAGKDAVFQTTVNHIVEEVIPELTDAYVTETYAEEGWKTVADLKSGIKQELENTKKQDYIQNYLSSEVTVTSIPDSILKHQENIMISYYRQYAEYMGVEMDEFLSTYLGVSTLEELTENNLEKNKQAATYYLVVQAIAEDAKISVTEEEAKASFEKNGSPDFDTYKDEYGIGYLKQVALCQKVSDYIAEKATVDASAAAASASSAVS